MKTKRDIIHFFSEALPEFAFVGEYRPNLVFRADRGDGLYWLIAIQRDGPACGLAVEIAATYDPAWQGESARPLGSSTGIAQLRLGAEHVDVQEEWFSYTPTAEGLRVTLEEIRKQLMIFGLPYLTSAELRLRNNPLLQAARAAARRVPPESCKGLEDALTNVGYRVDDLEHPAYIQIRNLLRATATPTEYKEDRRWINSLAYLILTRSTAVEQRIT